MSKLIVGAATVNQTPLDFSGNTRRILKLIKDAERIGAQILCFPELCIPGYGCEDAFLSMQTVREGENALKLIADNCQQIISLVGLPHYYEGSLYNCMALVGQGKVLGLSAKRLLPREGVHYEARWFRPWPFGKVSESEICGQRVPLGELSYRLGDLNFSVEICEEAWGAEPLSARDGHRFDLIFNPSASHFALFKYLTRKQLILNASRATHSYYVYTNLLGLEAGRIIYDGGVLVARDGELVDAGRRFGFDDGAVKSFALDLDLIKTNKIRHRAVSDVDPKTEGKTSQESISIPQFLCADPPRTNESASLQGHRRPPHHDVPSMDESRAAPDQKPVDSDGWFDLSQEEEFLQAEMLALFDYLRKSSGKGFVVSLSGGRDSSACCVLVAHMIAESLRQLGKSAWLKRFGFLQNMKPEELTDNSMPPIGRFLTCIYQATSNNSDESREAAQALAEELSAEYHCVDIGRLVENYQEMALGILKRPLDWETDDKALQNIQARVRSPLPWLVANVKQAILLTTSNRSEAALGYATMDGDCAGGLAPLGGIHKPFISHWLKWAERDCVLGLGPIGALAKVNNLSPRAELRPIDDIQTDEGDLMPYGILLAIERHLIRDRMSETQILTELHGEFSEYGREDLLGYIEKFVSLWKANQWKRERLAPSFHIDNMSLDPKTWCRYPILSGNKV